MMRLFTLLLLGTIGFLGGCQNRQDQADSLKAAERIHLQLTSKDYHSIYRESGESLKRSVSELQFVADMSRLADDVGALKKATPIAYKSSFDTAAGAKHILMFDLEFERSRAKENISFVRNKSGQMQVWDLNIAPVE